MVFGPLPTQPCKKCATPIPTFIVIDGVKRYHRRRKYCFVCNPFDSRAGRTIDGERQRQATHRTCRRCTRRLPVEEFHLTNTQRGYKNSYCKTCQTVRVRTSRQRFKDECIAYKGGKCMECGYDKCRDTLDFHHLGEKEFQLSRYQRCTLTDEVKAELDRCRLLCANCHREVHADPSSFKGFISVGRPT